MSESFLGRWSRRKQSAPGEAEAEDARLERERLESLPVAPVQVPADPHGEVQAAEPGSIRAETPDLPAVESLTPQADFTAFMKPEVPAQLKNAALKKLFADPHFNVMDGLDIYIDDYTKADPIPPAMLRALMQSRELRLFDYSAEEEAERQARELAAQEVQAGRAAGSAALASDTPQPDPRAGTVPLDASAGAELRVPAVRDDAGPGVDAAPQ